MANRGIAGSVGGELPCKSSASRGDAGALGGALERRPRGWLALPGAPQSRRAACRGQEGVRPAPARRWRKAGYSLSSCFSSSSWMSRRRVSREGGSPWRTEAGVTDLPRQPGRDTEGSRGTRHASLVRPRSASAEVSAHSARSPDSALCPAGRSSAGRPLHKPRGQHWTREGRPPRVAPCRGPLHLRDHLAGHVPHRGTSMSSKRPPGHSGPRDGFPCWVALAPQGSPIALEPGARSRALPPGPHGDV